MMNVSTLDIKKILSGIVNDVFYLRLVEDILVIVIF